MSEDNEKRLNWHKYTWEEFEDICFEYAYDKYDSDIYKVEITERRKDGGRDIIISDLVRHKIIWGECKHHRKSIGLNEIGKNVVLAITNQIHKIIFFSVSTITPNTKHEILSAAKIHSFDVLFLDGKNLDREIIGSKKLLNQYFEEALIDYNLLSKPLLVDICIDEFENAYNDTFYKDTRYCKLENGLDFYIHIFLKNYHSSVLNKIEVEIQDIEVCHFYKTNIFVNHLNSLCDTVLTIHGVLLNTQKVVTLPELTISYSLKKGKISSVYALGELDGRNIWKVPLCGANNIQFISSINELCRQVKQGYAKIIYLRGVSGSGKTRMLEEISSTMEKKGFVSIYVDAMICRKIHFFKEFIRQLLCLPDFSSKSMFTQLDFINLIQKYQIISPDILHIHSYIWKNRKISLTVLGEFLYECIAKNPISKRLYIQIDNIQCMDAEAQKCMLFLLNILLKEKLSICFAFSINTSIARETNSAPLIQYFETVRTHREYAFFLPYTMEELDTEGRKILVERCLKLPQTYKKEINEIANKAGSLPLDILLFCKTLYNSNCFIWDNGICEIEKPEEFSTRINELSSDISTVIELRIKTIERKYINKISVYKLIQLILFFENHMPIELVNAFRISPSLISHLKQELIITERSDATLSFYHDNYYRFYVKQGTVYSFTSKEWAKLLQYSKEYESTHGAAMRINQAKCMYYLYGKDDFCQFAYELLKEFCLLGYHQEIISLSNFYINKIRNAEYRNQRLLFATEKGLAQMETVSFIQGINYFKKIKENLDNDSLEYDSDILGRFYHQYTNSYTHAGRYQSALQVLHDFELINGLSLEYKFLIMDRYCLCYYSLGEFRLANLSIQKALKIGRKMKDGFVISTAYSEKAFNYLTNTNDTSKIKFYFRKAIRYYPEGNDTSSYRIIEIKIQSALTALLEKKYEQAILYCDEAIHYAVERTYTYLLIPARNVKAFALIMNGNASKAMEVLLQARFESELFGSTKLIITIFNTLGVAYCAQENFSKGHEYFFRAIKLLQKYSTPTESIYRFEPLIANWTLATFKNNFVSSNSDLSDYFSPRLKKIQSEITKDENLSSFKIDLGNYFPITYRGYALMY